MGRFAASRKSDVRRAFLGPVSGLAGRIRFVAALKGVATYDVTREIGARAGRLDGELVARGEGNDPGDVIVGVAALLRSEPVAMRNARHFARPKGPHLVTY